MAETFTEILEGPLDANAEVVEAITNGAIAQWAPVILLAAGSGETLPRVGTTTTANNILAYGIKSGPNKTLVAGDVAYVVVSGRVKCAFAGAASLGDSAGTSTTAGQAQAIAAVDFATTYAEADADAQLALRAAAIGEVVVAPGGTAGDIGVIDVRRNVGT